MKLWKSPVFYFGILLVMTVVSALLAPFLMDWGSYRSDLEAYGEKLTGRKVEIAGPISVRLFPWPRLTAQDVRIKNPDGDGEFFAVSDQIVIRMTLGALLNGVIQVEGIDIEQPKITLHRTMSGQGNWNFDPAENIRNSRLLEHVMLDKISIHNGTVDIIDDRRSRKTTVYNMNAELSAPGFAGPWRTSGELEYDGRPMSFLATTNTWERDKPLRLGLRVSSKLGGGYSYFVDGLQDGSRFIGQFRMEPVANSEGKGDTEGQFRPVKLKSELTADFNSVKLSKIEISPADTRDQGTLLTGEADIAIDKTVTVSANLAAPRVDFDTLAGAGSRRLLRDDGGLALINGLLTSLPGAVELRSTLNVAALRLAGQVLENVSLDIAANREAVRIHELKASLPGRSRTLFKGVFFPGENFAELGGELALETQDARQLALWLWPDNQQSINQTWKGSRGRFKVQTVLAVTASKIDFENAQYELDGEAGSGRLSFLTNGERPIIDLSINTSTADINNFVPDGFAAMSSNGGASWSMILAQFLDDQTKRDLNLKFNADKMRLNGVETSHVKLDLQTTIRGFDLKALDVDFSDGAKLNASGVVLNTSNGPDGELNINVTAENPSELLHLSGLIIRDENPPWETALGSTALKVNLKASPSDVEPMTAFRVAGTSGPLTLNASGKFAPFEGDGEPGFTGKLELASTSSAALARLLGATPHEENSSPANLTVETKGILNKAFDVDLRTSLYNANIEYKGTVHPWMPALDAAGGIKVTSADATELMRFLQAPAQRPDSSALTMTARLAARDRTLTLDGVKLEIAGTSYSGTASISPNRQMTGDFSVNTARLADVMTAAFLPWNGKAPSLEAPFATGLPFGMQGELWLRPNFLEVYPGVAVANAQVGLTASKNETRIAAYAKMPDGGKVAVEMAVRPEGPAHKISGLVVLPVNLVQNLKRRDGTALATGDATIDLTFSAEGRSAAAALASVNGKGSLTMQEAKLLAVSPDNFSQKMITANNSGDLQQAFQSLYTGQGIEIGALKSDITLVNGVASIPTFNVSRADADIKINTVAEFLTGRLDIGVTLALKALPNLPPMEVSFTGTPMQLEMQEDSVALSSFLGFKVLEKSVKELEKVQAEQARLAREEEELRKQDELKLEAFYAQKAELRLRARELRIHEAQRLLDAEIAVQIQARLIREGTEMNKQELRQRVRELRFFRRLIADASNPEPSAKPRARAVMTPRPTQVPLILVPPQLQ